MFSIDVGVPAKCSWSGRDTSQLFFASDVVGVDSSSAPVVDFVIHFCRIAMLSYSLHFVVGLDCKSIWDCNLIQCLVKLPAKAICLVWVPVIMCNNFF